jgi:hypothetical protein
MYNPTKPKPKIDPMNQDDQEPPRVLYEMVIAKFRTPTFIPTAQTPPSFVGGYSGLSNFRQSLSRAGGRRVGGATLKPKIYPPTLMRNAKPKNNFFK